MRTLVIFLICLTSLQSFANEERFPIPSSLEVGKGIFNNLHQRNQSDKDVRYQSGAISNLLKQVDQPSGMLRFESLDQSKLNKYQKQLVSDPLISLDQFLIIPNLEDKAKLSPKEIGNSDLFKSPIADLKGRAEQICNELRLDDSRDCEAMVNNPESLKSFAFRSLVVDNLYSYYELSSIGGIGFNCDLYFEKVSNLTKFQDFQRYQDLLEMLRLHLPYVFGSASFQLGSGSSLCVTRVNLNKIANIEYRFSRNALTLNREIFVNPSFFTENTGKAQSEIILLEQLYQFIPLNDYDERIAMAQRALKVIVDFVDHPEKFQRDSLIKLLEKENVVFRK